MNERTQPNIVLRRNKFGTMKVAFIWRTITNHNNKYIGNLNWVTQLTMKRTVVRHTHTYQYRGENSILTKKSTQSSAHITTFDKIRNIHLIIPFDAGFLRVASKEIISIETGFFFLFSITLLNILFKFHVIQEKWKHWVVWIRNRSRATVYK